MGHVFGQRAGRAQHNDLGGALRSSAGWGAIFVAFCTDGTPRLSGSMAGLMVLDRASPYFLGAGRATAQTAEVSAAAWSLGPCALPRSRGWCALLPTHFMSWAF
jgi:hypothetical protein